MLQRIENCRSAPRVVLVALLLLFAMGSALAQSTNSSELRGTVTDQTGAVVPGVNVVISNVETGVTKELTTNEAGIYDAVSILPG